MCLLTGSSCPGCCYRGYKNPGRLRIGDRIFCSFSEYFSHFYINLQYWLSPIPFSLNLSLSSNQYSVIHYNCWVFFKFKMLFCLLFLLYLLLCSVLQMTALETTDSEESLAAVTYLLSLVLKRSVFISSLHAGIEPVYNI